MKIFSNLLTCSSGYSIFWMGDTQQPSHHRHLVDGILIHHFDQGVNVANSNGLAKMPGLDNEQGRSSPKIQNTAGKGKM